LFYTHSKTLRLSALNKKLLTYLIKSAVCERAQQQTVKHIVDTVVWSQSAFKCC